MQEYYFANYRLITDDGIDSGTSMAYISNFKDSMPYTHTFRLHLGDYHLLDRVYNNLVEHSVVCSTDRFSVINTGDNWAIVSLLDEKTVKKNGKYVLICSSDFTELTLYISNEPYFSDEVKKWFLPAIPFSTGIRAACEIGICLNDGLPVHASLIEKDGYGIVFLGPSGMGKSTQAKLWQKYQGADIIIGDRPCLRCIDGVWYGFGMPWDGKDRIMNQKKVPVKALISLEQSKVNEITRLDMQQSMMVLLKQVMLPMWDDAAMDSVSRTMCQLASQIPMYHLKNLADKEATDLTLQAIG